MRAPFAALTTFLAATLAVSAQEYRFRVYGTEDGLTNLAVKVLFQDRIGFIWAATENGIFRFDGQHFKRYGPEEGLPRAVILSLGAAPDGSILAGCRKGLYRQEGDRFEQVALPGRGIVEGYGSIRAGKGRTYVATDRGLAVGSESEAGQLSWQLIATPPAAGMPNAHGILLEPDAVWYGCGASLCRLGRNGVTVYGHTDGLPAGRWMSIRRDGSGDLWLSDKGKFVALRRGTRRFDVSVHLFPRTAGVWQMEVDAEGRLLVPTLEGLMIGEGRRFWTVGKREGLQGTVYSVLQDREGSVWVGLVGKGLARWQGYGQWLGFSPRTGLDCDLIYEILPQAYGSLWVGTETGLFLGDKTGDRWIWRRHTAVGRIPVHAVRHDNQGNLWIGTEGHGAGRIDARTGEVAWFRKGHGLDAESPYSLAPDRSGRVWAATEHGLFVRQPAAAQFTRVAEVPGVRCWVVTQGAGGDILVGTDQGVYWLVDGNWRHLTVADGLRHDVVLAISAAQPGEIWLGYWFSGDVTRIQVEGEHFHLTHYGHDAGLRGELTYFLGFDAHRQLWAGSDQGLNMLDRNGWHHYSQEDGLIWNDCDLGAFASEPDGAVWIGTSAGLAHFQPRRARPPLEAPALVFTKLVLGDRQVDAGTLSGLPLSRAHSLSAEYSVLTFAHQGSLAFRYRLQPLFSDWRDTSLRELQFAGLPPGNYTLEVQASDGWAGWSKHAAAFTFAILAPWWSSWWFERLMAALLLGVFWAVWRWRSSQLVRRQKELERAVAAGTLELRREKQELLAAKEELRERAIKDGLTGLYNRNAFLEILGTEMARAKRQGSALAIILADLDHFKNVNDSYGHLAGDAVLRDTARRIREAVRQYDTVGRYGGEELVIALPECGRDEAARRAEEIRRRIAGEVFDTPGGSIQVTGSFGIAVTNGVVMNVDELLRAADQALYIAKARGRNCVAMAGEEASPPAAASEPVLDLAGS